MKTSELLEHLPASLGGITGQSWLLVCPVCELKGTAYVEIEGKDAGITAVCGCDVDEILEISGLSAEALIGVEIDTPELQRVTEPTQVPDKNKGSKSDSIDPYKLFHEMYDLYRTRDGMVVAHRKGDNTRTVTDISAMKATLMRDIYQREGKYAPKDKTAAALDMVRIDAEGLEQTDVALRAHHDSESGTVFVDLGTSDGAVVRVTASGWAVESPSNAHPLFRRNRTMGALPVPIQPSRPGALREILRMASDDSRWALIRGWLANALFAGTPRPLMWCQGPQGSGKTTAALLVHNVIEPRQSLGAPISKTEDAAVVAMGRYVVSFDNVSSVTRSLSDWFCRLVTGAEDEKRELFTDGDTYVMQAQRTGVITSLTIPVGVQADAIERIVKVPFQRMNEEQRTTDGAIWGTFHAVHAELFGAVLDDVSAILRHLPEVERRDAEGTLTKKRMAQYHMALMALDIEDGNDGAPDGLAAAYAANVSDALSDRALDDELALAVLAVVQGHGGKWEGYVKDLRSEVVNAATDDDGRTPKWVPGSPRRMGAALDEASEALRNAGLDVQRGKRAAKGVPIVLTATRDLSVLDLPSYAPDRPQNVRQGPAGPGIFDLQA